MKKIISSVLVFVFLMSNTYAMSFLDRRGRVEILMYHRICDNTSCNNVYCISPEEFENDLKYFKSNGYTSMFASELAKAELRGKKIIVITFDDGYKSDIEYAVPILEKYGFCASFYIFGSAIGKEGYLTENDLKAMAQKECVEIGNHTYELHQNAASTLNLLYSNSKNTQKIISDFEKNSKYIKAVTGKDVVTATYPNGEYSSEVDRILKANGILTTFSTKPYSFLKIQQDKPAGRKMRGAGADIKNLLK